MATEYNKKTVAELQEILKSRSLSHNGKKAELVARLTKDDEDKANTATATTTTTTTTTTFKADTADDVIDWDDDAALEEPAVAKPTSESGAAALAAGGKGSVPNPVAVPNQKLGENPATADDLKVESEGAAAAPAAKPEKPELETGATEEKEKEKPAADFTKGLPVTEMEEEMKKRKARAEKFGIVEDSQAALSEAEKKLQRAKRFGTAAEGDASVGVKGLDEALPEGRLRKRNRNDNDQGGRGGKRRDFGGGRNRNNRRRGNNNGGNGNRNNQQNGGRNNRENRPAWNEKDALAMEARKKRFATAA